MHPKCENVECNNHGTDMILITDIIAMDGPHIVYQCETCYKITVKNERIETMDTNELIESAMEILDDFDSYGPVLQSNESGEYDSNTGIGRLRKALGE